jgi:hypothetical protein
VRVAHSVPVVERQARKHTATNLGDQDRTTRRASVVEHGQAGQRLRVVVAGEADSQLPSLEERPVGHQQKMTRRGRTRIGRVERIAAPNALRIAGRDRRRAADRLPGAALGRIGSVAEHAPHVHDHSCMGEHGRASSTPRAATTSSAAALA